MEENLTWKSNTEKIKGKLRPCNYALRTLKNILQIKQKVSIYQALFRSHLEYGNILWGEISPKITKELETLQKCAIRYQILYGASIKKTRYP